MVVLSAAVLTKSGKALIARQFVAMTRLRIEGLLAAFPKLIGDKAQHTFIETENVRYVYQPMDSIFLVLITNKQSNIMEDLDTLRSFAKLIPEFCQGHDVASITRSAYELVFAMDELVSLGHREAVSLDQIRTFTEMDSHEEKLQKIIKESRMSEANITATRKAEELDRRKAEMRRIANVTGGPMGGNSSSQGFGSNSSGGGFGSNDQQQQQQQSQQQRRASSQSSSSQKFSGSKDSESPRGGWKAKPSGKRSKGMAIGIKNKKDKTQKAAEDMFEKLRVESRSEQPSAAAAQQLVVDPSAEPITIEVTEKLSCQLERDGALKKLEIKGELNVTVTDPDYAQSVVTVTEPPAKDTGFAFRPHPKIDKTAWTKQNALQLKGGKSHPIGAANKQAVLKWRLQTTDEAYLPLRLNFWPSEENGESVVSVEYSGENDFIALKNVVISIPCGRDQPDIQTQDGQTSFDRQNGVLHWHIDEINNGDEGTLEFNVPEQDADDFHPIEITFSSEQTFSGLQVETVTHAETGEELAADGIYYSLNVDKFGMQ